MTLSIVERAAMMVILVCTLALVGSALAGFVSPESKERQAERLRPLMELRHDLGWRR